MPFIHCVKFLLRLCKPIDGTKADDVSNLYESLIGNFEDIVQYNKDNKAFEGGKHDNVTIETLCDIMAGGEISRDKEKMKEMQNNLEQYSIRCEAASRKILNQIDVMAMG